MNALRVSVAAVLLASSAGIASVSVHAQEPDPLVTDGLAALDALVNDEVCVGRDAADDDIENGVELPYRFCDDGVVPSGGGSKGIPVPVKYAADAEGDDWTGLPAPASQDEVDAADADEDLQPESDNRITLDVDITLPPGIKAPAKGYPVIVFMHGCCGGNRTSWESATVDGAKELWHHSNAWFAARDYVVVNYTARGFRNSMNQGSTGTTQLGSRRYEVNDYQYLVGLLADHDAMREAAGEDLLFNINPKKVATVGGSYGGGFSWLALTDPKWKSPAEGITMSLAASVPKYGWTDLVESLVPSGHYYDRDPKNPSKTYIATTDVAKAPSRSPIGVEKQSIVSGLYATGNLGSGNHTTFPQYLHDTYARLQAGEPYDGDAVIEDVADKFLNDRSAYYQNGFWTMVKKGVRVPVFASATWTDPLFPTMETVRFYNKLRAVDPGYPITMYVGDYQHFVANKAKEWDDMCGDDHHVCAVDDYRKSDESLGNLNKAPSRVRVGINSRINKFLDYYLRGIGKKPKANVSATTTICEANSNPDKGFPTDEPGIEYRAANWRALAPKITVLGWSGGGAPASSMAQDAHAAESDPVFRDQQSNKCYTTTQTNPGEGVYQLISEELAKGFTMLGIPTLTLEYTTLGSDYWISARLYDMDADGAMTLVARNACKVNTDADPEVDCTVFDLSGNAWTFDKGHKAVVEISESDTPFLRRDNLPSTVTVTSANIQIPTTTDALRHDFRD